MSTDQRDDVTILYGRTSKDDRRRSTDQRDDLTILYGRTSKDDRRRLTIENQQKALRKWALEDPGVAPAVEELWDDGVSGKIPLFERAKGRRIRELIQENPGRRLTLACVYIDRFARNTLTGLQAAAELEEAGVKLVAIHDGHDTRTEHDPTYFQLRLVMAEAEHRRIRERTQKGIARALEQGEVAPTGVLAFGYRLGPGGRWEKHLIEAPLVRHMYEMIAAGEPLGAVRAWLKSLPGVRPGRRYQRRDAAAPHIGTLAEGAQWSEATAKRILRNPCYKGTRLYMGHVFPVPPIVDEQLWDRVQAILEKKGRKHREARAEPPVGFLSGLITCGHCGQRIWAFGAQGYWRKGKRYTYARYRCRTSKRNHRLCKCAMPQVPLLDARVWPQIEAYIRNPADLLRRLVAADREQSGRLADLDSRAAALDLAIAAADAEIAEVWAMQAKYGWPLSHVERGIQAIHGRRQAAVAELDDLRKAKSRACASQEEVSQVAASLAGLRALLDDPALTTAGKAQIAGQVIKDAVMRTVGAGRSKMAELTIRLKWAEVVQVHCGARDGAGKFDAPNYPSPEARENEGTHAGGPDVLPIIIRLGRSASRLPGKAGREGRAATRPGSPPGRPETRRA